MSEFFLKKKLKSAENLSGIQLYSSYTRPDTDSFCRQCKCYTRHKQQQFLHQELISHEVCILAFWLPISNKLELS